MARHFREFPAVQNLVQMYITKNLPTKDGLYLKKSKHSYFIGFYNYRLPYWFIYILYATMEATDFYFTDNRQCHCATFIERI